MPDLIPLPHETIIAEECAATGVKFHEVTHWGRSARSTKKPYLKTRWAIVRRLRVEQGWSAPHIGRLVKRDTSTIWNALRRMEVK